MAKQRPAGVKTDQEALDESREQAAAAGEQQHQGAIALTGHTNTADVVEDPVTGKVQALHTTTVVTDPTSPEAVQGHDDPRVNGATADPLRREPSPNDIADGAEVPEDTADSHVTVGESSDSDEDVTTTNED